MDAGFRSDDEIVEIAKEVIDMLRPKHLMVGQIREVLKEADKGLEYVVVQEKPN